MLRDQTFRFCLRGNFCCAILGEKSANRNPAAVSTETLKSNPGIIVSSSVIFNRIFLGSQRPSNYRITGTDECASGCVSVFSETHRQTCSHLNQPEKNVSQRIIWVNHNFGLNCEVLAFIPIYNNNVVLAKLIAEIQEHGNFAKKLTGNNQKPSDNHIDFKQTPGQLNLFGKENVGERPKLFVVNIYHSFPMQ